MERVDPNKVLAKIHELVNEYRDKPDKAKLQDAQKLCHDFLNHNPDSPAGLYFLGLIYGHMGCNGAAVSLLSRAVQIAPQTMEAWNNLGLCLRRVKQREGAIKALTKALQIKPNSPLILGNLAACYINEGVPGTALKLADEALAARPTDDSARWNKCLALLELGRFKEAWELHEVRLGGEIENRIAIRNYHPDRKTPWWDGKRKELVVCHGEQGLGDEIMFASCLPDAIATGARVIVECAPRLEKTFRRSFPGAVIHGTHDVDGHEWTRVYGLPDSMTALGSLPRFFRNDLKDFPRKPFLKNDPMETEKILARLPSGKPLVGIAWEGGVHETRYSERSVPLNFLHPLLMHDVTWVSVNYLAGSAQEAELLRSESGIKIHHHADLVQAPADIDNLVNLVAGLDLVITVSQTVFHVCGALGIPCWILAPRKPDWRLGVRGSHLPWYGDEIRIFRQTGDHWHGLIERMSWELGRALDRAAQNREAA